MNAVAFRVDASNQIGSGHLRRCLTLAALLKKHGVKIMFVCRDAGGLDALITGYGFSLTRMAKISKSKILEENDVPPEYQYWLATTQIEDANEFNFLLSKQRVDWVITDHYALGKTWETEVKKKMPEVKILVIDDLANRKHETDLLLDQSFLRSPEDYKSLVNDYCQCLTGVDYCLIRDEFLDNKNTISIEDAGLFNIVVTLGGVDSNNWTNKILQSLNTEHVDFKLDIVMGINAPYLLEVKKTLEQFDCKNKLWVNTNQMAEILSAADIVITAAGTTVWELCTLNKPFVLIKTAENQQQAFSALASKSLSKCYETPETFIEDLKEFDIQKWRQLSSVFPQNYCMVDGNGAERVYKAMKALS